MCFDLIVFFRSTVHDLAYSFCVIFENICQVIPYSGKRKLKPIVTFMKKEIEKAKKEKAKVRYFLLILIDMNCVYCAHSPCCACVYAPGGGTEEEISE